MYNPITKKIIISRDVEFMENESLDGLMDTSSSTSQNVPINDDDDEYEDQQDVATIDGDE